MRIQPFDTVYGRNLLAEVPNFAHSPTLIVTMQDLWPKFSSSLPNDQTIYFVRSMDAKTLDEDLQQLPPFSSVVGLGGGQALDTAKYFSWRRQRPGL